MAHPKASDPLGDRTTPRGIGRSCRWGGRGDSGPWWPPGLLSQMDGRTPVEAVAGMSMVQPVGRDLGGEPSPLGGRFYDPMHFTGIERPALAGHEHGRIRRGLTKA
jgi:hypothetical protein